VTSVNPQSIIRNPQFPLMHQSWRDLLFAHWPVVPEQLLPHVPAGLTLDRYEGQAWISVVPFRMTGVRLYRQPVAAPWLGAFPELNVRTYVTPVDGGKPGVLFFSLDAGNPLAVAAARRWFHLPYFYARMRLRHEGDAIVYQSRRVHPGAPAALFDARYWPTGPPYTAPPGSLDDWLTARYCLYTTDRAGRLYRCDIAHQPWPLQPAEGVLRFNMLTRQHGIRLPDRPPLLQFARRLDIVAWPLIPVPA
jgi:uncharacterized protein YqjF (DUF2071 family)